MLFCKYLAFTNAGHVSAENKLSAYFSDENTTQIFCHKIKGVQGNKVGKEGKNPVTNKGVQGTLVQLMWCQTVGTLN